MQSAQGMLHQLLKNMPKHNSLEYKTYPVHLDPVRMMWRV